jgi:acyl-CoA-binding protein
MSLQEQFDSAKDRVSNLKSRPSNEDLLQLYALFKQATAGDASGKRPGMFDLKGRAKFDAWAGKKGTGKDDAMQAYVSLVERLESQHG